MDIEKFRSVKSSPTVCGFIVVMCKLVGNKLKLINSSFIQILWELKSGGEEGKIVLKAVTILASLCHPNNLCG